MELFPAQPDLSLQISPPNSKPTSGWRRTDENKDLSFWKRALDPKNSSYSMATDTCFDLSLSNPRASEPNSNPNPNPFQQNKYPNHQNHIFQQQQQPYQGFGEELGFLRPIRGIPIYQNAPHFSLPQHQQPLNTTLTSTNSINQNPFQPHQGLMRSRFLSRYPGKRSMRAPRMRWTTTLHARFVHAVELLGGHERATPKSVLELMAEKDLTLAHVKSHLQMYRTVKTTDRAAASSGQSDLFENGSSGDTSEDLLFENQNSRRPEISSKHGIFNVHHDKDYHGFWSNSSSREAWLLHGNSKECGGNIVSLEKDINTKCLNYERISEVNSSSLSTHKKPNLEFTLGRPQ